MRLLLLLVACCACPLTLAQPTACPSDLEIAYDGPCYYGTLPAFFDDFEYTSARTTGAIGDAPEGDLFGKNTWHLREGKESTRAWYRYNRDDLPYGGRIAFTPSTMALLLPEGMAAEDYLRSLTVMSGFTAREGTYHWRVKLSDLWPGQWVRQAAWVVSPNRYVFERTSPVDSVRYDYWSELDFENENHYQGEWRNGEYSPDFFPRMQVTNHYGHLLRSDGSHKRLDRNGVAPWEAGAGTLVRRDEARGTTDPRAPRFSSWSDSWWHLMLTIDGEDQTVTYRMLPGVPSDASEPLAARSVTTDTSFYPEDFLSPVLSLHWLHAKTPLAQTLTMEADWFYYSPVVGLSDSDVREQVALLRRGALPRMNTTGRPTFETRDRRHPITAVIDGPHSVSCGQMGTWTASVEGGGSRYLSTLRYRLEHADGSQTPWIPVYDRVFSFTPSASHAGLAFEASFQDLWAPKLPTTAPNGWQYPHPDNLIGRATHEVSFDCGER